jgi:hypothetical protein
VEDGWQRADGYSLSSLHFIGVYLCGLVVEEKNEKMQEG